MWRVCVVAFAVPSEYAMYSHYYFCAALEAVVVVIITSDVAVAIIGATIPTVALTVRLNNDVLLM